VSVTPLRSNATRTLATGVTALAGDASAQRMRPIAKDRVARIGVL
jgi:hypothetical protein